MARDVWREYLEEGGYEYDVVAGYDGCDEGGHIDTLPTREEAEKCAAEFRTSYGPGVTVGVYKSRRRGA